jgi:hypothetical protein
LATQTLRTANERRQPNLRVGRVISPARTSAFARHAATTRCNSVLNELCHELSPRLHRPDFPSHENQQRCLTSPSATGDTRSAVSPAAGEPMPWIPATPRKPPIPSACENNKGRAQYPPYERYVEQYTKEHRHAELANGRE